MQRQVSSLHRWFAWASMNASTCGASAHPGSVTPFVGDPPDKKLTCVVDIGREDFLKVYRGETAVLPRLRAAAALCRLFGLPRRCECFRSGADVLVGSHLCAAFQLPRAAGELVVVFMTMRRAARVE